MTPDELKTQAQNHATNLAAAQNQLDTKKVHPQSPEGNVFQIILDALDFVLRIFHHGQTATAAAIKAAEPSALPADASETTKA
jgi:hypothetical protein